MKKKALITGASGDIGCAIVKILQSEYEIYAHTFQKKEFLKEQFQKEISNGMLHVIVADLSVKNGAQILLQKIPSDMDLVIFCAGQEHYGLFVDTSEADYERMMCLHLENPMKITQELLKSMILKRDGNIIFISSIWGQLGASCEVLYSTFKGAQNTFVKALAKEMAPSGIRINAVAPGVVDTRMMNGFTDSECADLMEEIPMGRFAKPIEIAKAIQFLASNDNSYMTGSILTISGGWQIP